MTLAPDNPMRAAAMSVLIFEVIIVWLAYIGMIQVSGVDLAVAAVWSAVASVLCIVALAGLRKRWGYLAGGPRRLCSSDWAFSPHGCTPWVSSLR